MCSLKQFCEISGTDHLHIFSLHTFLKLSRHNFYFILSLKLTWLMQEQNVLVQ